MAGVSDFHRPGLLDHHRHRQPVARRMHAFGTRRNTNGRQLMRRQPQIHCGGFPAAEHKTLIMKFFGHAGLIATRVPEKIRTVKNYFAAQKNLKPDCRPVGRRRIEFVAAETPCLPGSFFHHLKDLFPRRQAETPCLPGSFFHRFSSAQAVNQELQRRSHQR